MKVQIGWIKVGRHRYVPAVLLESDGLVLMVGYPEQGDAFVENAISKFVPFDDAPQSDAESLERLREAIFNILYAPSFPEEKNYADLETCRCMIDILPPNRPA